jgi:hypothetical protein
MRPNDCSGLAMGRMGERMGDGLRDGRQRLIDSFPARDEVSPC